MLNCKQATELMSQEQDRSLVFKERLGLRFHLAMCGGCRNFHRQMAFLHEACARYPDAGTEENNERKAL
ncbi:MAG: zf-HC2 domain-containing protein [Sulfuricellaceae bacterium]